MAVFHVTCLFFQMLNFQQKSQGVLVSLGCPNKNTIDWVLKQQTLFLTVLEARKFKD